MNRRALHHTWTKLRLVPSYLFLILAGFSLVIGLMAMRQNNITALRLRDDVLRVDQENGDVEAALRKLREHVYSHMNSDLSGGSANVQQPVQLKYRYERLVTAEKARVSAANESIYRDAQADCERRFPLGLSGRGRIPCIEEYVSSRTVAEQPIQDSLYKFAFVSPAWSPDLAGISLLISAVSILLFLVRFSLGYWIRARLQEHM